MKLALLVLAVLVAVVSAGNYYEGASTTTPRARERPQGSRPSAGAAGGDEPRWQRGRRRRVDAIPRRRALVWGSADAPCTAKLRKAIL